MPRFAESEYSPALRIYTNDYEGTGDSSSGGSDDEYPSDSFASLVGGRSGETCELQHMYASRGQTVLDQVQQLLGPEFLFDSVLFSEKSLCWWRWYIPFPFGASHSDNNYVDYALPHQFAPRKDFDAVDTTRRRCDTRAPFPIQQFYPQQETRWVIPHETIP